MTLRRRLGLAGAVLALIGIALAGLAYWNATQDPVVRRKGRSRCAPC